MLLLSLFLFPAFPAVAVLELGKCGRRCQCRLPAAFSPSCRLLPAVLEQGGMHGWVCERRWKCCPSLYLSTACPQRVWT